MVMPRFDIFSLQLSPTPASQLRAFSSAQRPISTFYPYPRGSQPCSMTTTMPVKPSHQAPNGSSQAFTTLPEMPLELILSIIEFACAEGDREQNVPLLLACCLVCKTWSVTVQKILFTEAILRSQSSFQLFLSAVDRTTPRGRMLGDSVKRMRVVLDHNQPSSLHHHSFAIAVTCCPNLFHLDISLYGCAEPGKDVVGVPNVSRLRRLAPSFDDQTISLLKSGPKIDSLNFNNWSENQQSIYQLLDIWPSLLFLSIGGTTPLPQANLPPLPSALQRLSLRFQNTPSVEFMRWLLHNSTTSLRLLHCDRDPCVDTLEYLMSAFGSQLESISMPTLASPECAVMISGCSQLRRLHTESSSLPATFYKNLPSGLAHLALSIDHDTQINAIIDYIMAKDTLRTLHVFLWDGGRTHPLLSPLRIACTYRGIELTMTSDLCLFRADLRN